MKKNNFQLSIFNFQFILLLLIASCARNYDNDHAQVQNNRSAPDFWLSIPNLPVDSLLRLAATVPPDTILATIYYQIGDKYYRLNDMQKAREYYRKANSISVNLDWYRGRTFFAERYPNILDMEGLVDSSIIIHRQVLALARERKNELDIALITANMGISYAFYKNWHETALSYFFEAISIFEKRGDKYFCAQLYDIIGYLYGKMKMYDEGLVHHEKALDIFSEKPDTLLRASALINYAGMLAEAQKEFDKAENCLHEALRICTLNNIRYNLGNIYSNFAGIELYKFELDKAEMYARKHLDLVQERKDAEKYSFVFMQLADIELNRGNFRKSKEYAAESLKTAIENNIPQTQIDCYKILSALSVARHDFKNRMLLNAKVDSIENVMMTEKSVTYAKEMAAKYETEKKELEIEQQKNIIQKQNMQRWLLAAGIAGFAIMVALMWYMLRLRNRRNSALSELNLALSQRNDALSEMNAAKDKFFNIISHDLKNPAVALLDALKMLVKNGRVWDTVTLTDYYGELLHSAEGHVELIHHLLSWAKVQTGRIACAPEAFYLSARLRFDVSQVRGMAAKKGVALADAIPDDALVTADGNILATVVRNLLTNAVKFTASGGTVTLSAEPADNGKHIIAVSDTGIGMTKEQTGNLFRLDNARSQPGTANEQGTGLGLIVCRDLLEKHGTTLQVESEEGKGSRFWFEV